MLTIHRENAILTAYLNDRRPLAAIAHTFDLALEGFLEWLSTPRVQAVIESVRRLEEQRAAASAALRLHQLAIAEDSTPAQALRACATLVRLLSPRATRRSDAERPPARVARSTASVEHVPSAARSTTPTEPAHAPRSAAPAEHTATDARIEDPKATAPQRANAPDPHAPPRAVTPSSHPRPSLDPARLRAVAGSTASLHHARRPLHSAASG